MQLVQSGALIRHSVARSPATRRRARKVVALVEEFPPQPVATGGA